LQDLGDKAVVMERSLTWQTFIYILSCTGFVVCGVRAGDQPQWGQQHSRNMVSGETDLAEAFDPATGKNIKWVARLGTRTYSTPVVAGGKVLIGTNNEDPRDARHKGDRGVLLCLDEKDGSLCWQLVVPKLGGDPYLDWPKVGIVAVATVEGDRIYVMTNRAQIVCLDINGHANGNDGPYKDEGRFMVEEGSEPMEVGDKDADIIWVFDLRSGVGMYPHDAAHSSILLYGQFLYVNTVNGVDNTHKLIRCPEAPSLVVLDKKTGRLVAQDNERIGPRIFHSTWSSPALGDVDGRALIFFCGGDGVCYAFEPVKPGQATSKVEMLKRVWRFDCDPAGPKENVHEYSRNFSEGPSNVMSMPVFDNDRVYVTVGGDIWWGKKQAWLKCIDGTGAGEITKGGELWSYPLDQHCCSTPSIQNGLVFVADCGQKVHCVDAETGKQYWSHQTKGEIWASTLVADEKVYIGTRRKDFWVLAASRDKRVISMVELDSPIVGTVAAANGVLYITTMKKLYAVKQSGD
jgi:outer membrane protein assembly factor BamB